MQIKMKHKILSVLLAAALFSSVLTSSLLSVFAADTPPMTGNEALKTNQPGFNGYRIWDIRDWTPQEDRDAEFLRARVPLQQRNEPFKPTQANPDLDADAQIMLMQSDYGDSFVDGMMYNNTFAYNTLNYWQYVDYFSPWHGAAGAKTPKDLHDYDYENTADRGWEKRYFEFGILNIPNPAWTNAAHRNGVKSIACIYFDQYYRPGQTIDELYVQDENGKFPVAEKLIEMADYFGYDGYFFNCEEKTSNEEGQKKFLARLAQSDLWTQYYDTNSAMDDKKTKWLHTDIDGVDTQLQDSVFINYSWPGALDTPAYDGSLRNFPYMTANNINPFEKAFYGVEANQGKFSGSHPTANKVEELYAQGTKNPRASIALFTPSDWYARGWIDEVAGAALPDLVKPEKQWIVEERERMYFSGVKSNPTDTGDQAGFSRPEVGVADGSKWPGVADFTSERSVVGGTTFYTNFSTGKGTQYFTNGQVSRDENWSNINAQSILPSWQWWIEETTAKLMAPKAETTHAVTIDSAIKNGKITVDAADMAKVKTGTTVKVTVTPDEGYALKANSLMANNVKIDAEKLEFNMLDEDVIIKAEFETAPANAASHAIIIDAVIENGEITVDAEDMAQVKTGATVKITVKPAAEYIVKQGTLKINNVDADKLSFEMPDEAVTITAEFEKAAVDAAAKAITIDAAIQNGAIAVDAADAAKVIAGTPVVIAVTPDEGYALKAGSLKVNDIVNESESFIMPDAEVTITAEFELKADKTETHAITIDSEIKNGKITVDAKDMAAVKSGETVKATVAPDTDYVLKESSLKANDVLIDAQKLSFEMPDKDVTITVEFVKKTANLSAPRKIGEPFKADFDYGTTHVTEATEFEHMGAYNGGNSLVVTGDLAKENLLRLYKTNLSVTSGSKMDITFNKLRTDDTEMKLALIFKDAPDDVEYISIPDSNKRTSSWTTKTVELGSYAGKEIATIGLAFTPKGGTTITEYQMNIGEIKLSDGTSHTPSQPTGFAADRTFDDEMIVKWNLADFAQVDSYEIFATLSNGEKLNVGKTYDDIYYIKSFFGEDKAVKLELVAIGKDGSRSEPAVINFDYQNKASKINVVEETKQIITREDAVVKGSMKQSDSLAILNASWTSPKTDYKELKLAVTMDDSKDKTVFQSTVPKGKNSAEIIVPRGHGEKYQLAISTVLNDGTVTEPMMRTGFLKDVYVEPYDPKFVSVSGKTAIFWCPDAKDWLRLHVTANGEPVAFSYAFGREVPTMAIRAATKMRGTLPSANGIMEIVIEDYAGNFSEPVTVPYGANAVSAPLTATMVPDAVLLEAIKAQAGATLDAVAAYKGDLILTGKDIKNAKGVELLANAKVLDLTGTGIKQLGNVGNYEKVIAKDCKSLDIIYDMEKTKELDITGCSALKILKVNNSDMEKLTYGDVKNLSKLISVDMSNAKFDLSAGTSEKLFVDAIAKQAEGKDDITQLGTDLVNLAKGLVPLAESTMTNAKVLFDGNLTNQQIVSKFPVTAIVKFDAPQKIHKYKLTQYNAYTVADFDVSYSNDGSTWTVWGDAVTENTNGDYSQEISDSPAATYYKLTAKKSNLTSARLYELELMDYVPTVYPAGVLANDQRPEAITTYPQSYDAKLGQGIVDAAMIKEAKTVRGTDFASLAGKDFIAGDFDIAAAMQGEELFIKLTDLSGNVTANKLDTAKENTYKAEFMSFNTPESEGKVINTTTIKVGNGGVIVPPTPTPTPPVDNNNNNNSGSGGYYPPVTTPPSVSIIDNANSSGVNIRPGVTTSGSDAVVTVPNVDVSKATAKKPIKVSVNVPTEQILGLINNSYSGTISVKVVVPSKLANTPNVEVSSINIDKDIFRQAKDKQKTLVFNVTDETGKFKNSWSFNKEITNITDVNLAVMLKPSATLPIVAKQLKATTNAAVVRFLHNGALPSSAAVKLDVSKSFNPGDTLSLYYNNTAMVALELQEKDIKVDVDGTILINIDHCSDYVLLRTGAGAALPSTIEEPTSNPQTAVGSPVFPAAMTVAMLILLGASSTIILNKKRDEE